MVDCHPVKNVIFILLYRMSLFPTKLQYYAFKLLYTLGDIFIECHPLTDFAKNVTAAIGFATRTVHIYFSCTRHL